MVQHVVELHTFDSATNQRFWRSCSSHYQGERSAPELLLVFGSYVKGAVLDAGAADGSLMRAIRERFPSVRTTGVDLAPKSPEVEQADLKDLRFEDATFDTVINSEVIEHVTPEDADSILRELRRVLKPGGHLIVTTPFAEDLEESVVSCPCCETRFHRWGHQQRFEEQDLAALAAENGFQPVETLVVRLNRVHSIRFLGPRLLRNAWARRYVRGKRGKRTLILVARKDAS